MAELSRIGVVYPRDLRRGIADGLGWDSVEVDGRWFVRPRTNPPLGDPIKLHKVWHQGQWLDRSIAQDVLCIRSPAEVLGTQAPTIVGDEFDRHRSQESLNGELSALSLTVRMEVQQSILNSTEQGLRRVEQHAPGVTAYLVECSPWFEQALGAVRINNLVQRFGSTGVWTDAARFTEGVADGGLDPVTFSVWLSRLAPFVEGVVLTRTPHLMLVCFDRPVLGDGGRRMTPDLLNASSLSDSDDPGITARWMTRPNTTPVGTHAGLAAWVAGLCELFSVLTDPRYHVGLDGCIDFSLQHATFMDVVRSLRIAQSLQVLGRADRYAQRSLVFDLLDTLQALCDRNVRMENNPKSQISQWLRPTQLDSRLIRVRKELGPRNDAVWARLRMALETYDGCGSSGHWDPSLINPQGTKVKAGGRWMPLDDGLGYLVQTLRHSYTHSYTAALNRNGRRSGIFYAHDGDITSLFGYLSTLFVFDLVANPFEIATTNVTGRALSLKSFN